MLCHVTRLPMKAIAHPKQKSLPPNDRDTFSDLISLSFAREEDESHLWFLWWSHCLDGRGTLYGSFPTPVPFLLTRALDLLFTGDGEAFNASGIKIVERFAKLMSQRSDNFLRQYLHMLGRISALVSVSGSPSWVRHGTLHLTQRS